MNSKGGKFHVLKPADCGSKFADLPQCLRLTRQAHAPTSKAATEGEREGAGKPACLCVLTTVVLEQPSLEGLST